MNEHPETYDILENELDVLIDIEDGHIAEWCGLTFKADAFALNGVWLTTAGARSIARDMIKLYRTLASQPYATLTPARAYMFVQRHFADKPATISIPDAAEMLSVSLSRVRRWTREDVLSKPAGSTVSYDDVIALAERRADPTKVSAQFRNLGG